MSRRAATRGAGRTRQGRAGTVLAALGLIAGCSSAGPAPAPSTVVSTAVHTVVPSPTYTPPPVTTVAPLPPSASPPAGEQDGRCPYIAASSQENANTNVADILGSHVYRTTVLTGRHPVGCRFYFYAPPYSAIADIEPTTFDSAVAARNAMIRTGEQGTQVIGRPDLATGVVGVSYRTAFYGPDDGRNWACAFAHRDLLVVVHTQRIDTAEVAVLLAQAIIPVL